MPEFRREHHRLIAAILKSCDADFLSDAGCYFGGGTQIAMQLVEYRESRDIDFLCGDQAGVRKIRETVTQQSLGKILRKKIPLAREVRADRYGVRTFFAAHDTTIKFEIVFEARIALSGAMSREFGVPVLDLKHAVAEKLLANTDRGLDESTRSRDLIDLAFLVAHHGRR